MRAYRSSLIQKLLLALAALTLSAGPVHADLAGAAAAYKAQDFETARAQFMQLAALGEPRAQFNLGAMALRGEGMAKDEGVGAGWMRAATQNGYKGMDENKLQLIEAGLNSRGQEASAQILAKYGRRGTPRACYL